MLTIYFDGTCPLCAIEMKHLKRRDKSNELRLVDIYSPSFPSEYPHIDIQRANEILHAEDDNGKLYLGLDVSYEAWSRVGHGYRVAFLRWPLIKPIADKFYILFARNRYRISFMLTGQRRCEQGVCNK